MSRLRALRLMRVRESFLQQDADLVYDARQRVRLRGEPDMTVTVLEAGKQMGRSSSWRLSNLEMQKIVYLAHMFHLGRKGRPLVYGYFEAWDLGPVHPDLYHFVKSFGSRPINNNLGMFDFIDDMEAGTETELLDSLVRAFPPGSGPKLLRLTHSPPSAWYEVYKPDRRNLVITNDLIAKEYEDRSNGR